MNKTNVKIGQYTWEVKKVPFNSDHLMLNGEPCFGITDFLHLKIHVTDQKVNPQVAMSTLIHELAHAYMFSLGFRAETFDEEDVCYFIEAQSVSIINMANELYKKLFVGK